MQSRTVVPRGWCWRYGNVLLERRPLWQHLAMDLPRLFETPTRSFFSDVAGQLNGSQLNVAALGAGELY